MAARRRERPPAQDRGSRHREPPASFLPSVSPRWHNSDGDRRTSSSPGGDAEGGREGRQCACLRSTRRGGKEREGGGGGRGFRREARRRGWRRCLSTLVAWSPRPEYSIPIHISAQLALEMGPIRLGPSPTRIRLGPSPAPIHIQSGPDASQFGSRSSSLSSSSQPKSPSPRRHAAGDTRPPPPPPE
jgi:hypothetical protein